jgi:hypothetical protein
MNRMLILVSAAAAIVGGLIGSGITMWWNSASVSPYANYPIYDQCLYAKNGNTVACDAMLRMLKHQEALRQAEEMLGPPPKSEPKQDDKKP